MRISAGEDSTAELCRNEGIKDNLYYRRSKEFMRAGKGRMAGDWALQSLEGVDPPFSRLHVELAKALNQ